MRIPVEGAERVASGVTGLQVSCGLLTFRYSHAVWVDAMGQRSHIPAIFSDGEINLTVPVELIAQSNYPAVLDPIISPELSVDEQTLVPNPWAGSEIATAQGGAQTLVVWTDNRNGSEIFGARVAPDGSVLDELGFRIASGHRVQHRPAVSWDGTNFFVVWSDSGQSSQSTFVAGARVSPAGAVLDPAGIMISPPGGSVSGPVVAWNGSNHFVVWVSSSNSVLGARVSVGGVVLDPMGISLANSAYQASIAWSGAESLIAWGTSGGIRAGRFDALGQSLDDGGVQLSSSLEPQFDPLVSWGGSSFLVAWSERGFPEADVHAARVNVAGQVLDSPSIAVATGPSDDRLTAIGRSGNDWILAWRDSSQSLSAASVDSAGVARGHGPVIQSLAGGASISRIGPDVCLVARTSSGFSVRLLDSTGSPGDAGIIGIQMAAEQREPDIASNGFDFLLVWSSNGVVYGARIDRNGRLQDPTGFVIGRSNIQALPSVAWGAGEYLVVWRNRGMSLDGGLPVQLLAARVTTAGVVLDVPALLLTQGTGNLVPSVASNGSEFLVVWDETRGVTALDIYALRVSATGVPLEDGGFPVSTEPFTQLYPHVAWGDGGYLVVWTDRSASSGDIIGARVSASGTVLDPMGIEISSAPGEQYLPSVAWSGAQFQVTWGEAAGLTGARVTPAGVVLDPNGVLLATALTRPTALDVAWNGQDSVAIWNDYDAVWGMAVWAASFSPSGPYQVDGGFQVSEPLSSYSSPLGAISCGAARQCVVVAEQFDERPLFQSRRIKAHFVVDGHPPIAAPQVVSTPQNAPVTILLSGSDADGDPLDWELLTLPANGLLMGMPPALTFVPSSSFVGSDSFSFRVLDGALKSATAVVTLIIGDAGTLDGGMADGGSLDDGGFADDGGSLDTGFSDGGGLADGGGSLDGGSLDSGSLDGGSLDGGSLDGGSLDGGSLDGGSL
ncbi:MAG: hypothetical protein GQE15_03910, partial [Archangiaceae bacterium]|nr:hypothetical protein [Archangiaceae bacterium]